MSKKKLSLIPPDENHTFDMFSNRIEKKEGDLTPSADENKDIQLFERMFSFWWLTVFEHKHKKLLPKSFEDQKKLYAYCFDHYFRKKLNSTKIYVIKNMYLVPDRFRGLSTISVTFTYLIKSFESKVEKKLIKRKEDKEKSTSWNPVELYSNLSFNKSLSPLDKKDIDEIIEKGAVNKDVEAVVKNVEQTPALQRLWNSVRASWDSLFSKKGGTRKRSRKM